MEMRRQNDIVAFKMHGQKPVAFHSRNLEVAEISDELWTEMSVSTDPELSAALNEWSAEENPEVKSGHLDFGIRSLTLNVTQICNLKCTYCAAGGDGTYGEAQTKINVEKTLPQLKFFLEKVPEGGSFNITFLGGEPLLYPDGIREIGNYVRLMVAGRNVQARFSIVTNGTLFTDANIDLLRDLKCKITVSIDGRPEVNDVARPLRSGKGATAKILEGLEKVFARKSELGTIIFQGVFTKSNLNVVDAYQFYKELPADIYHFDYGVTEDDEAANTEFIDQMNEVARLAYISGGEKALRKIDFFNKMFIALDEQQRTENYCGAGKSFLVVDAKNNLYPCPWFVGQKDEQVGQGSHLDSKALEAYQSPLIEKNNCQTCWAKFLCGGGCLYIHQHGGSEKHRKNTEFCRRMRSLIGTSIIYYKLSRNTASEGSYEEQAH